jgi:hypothetical protein
MHAYKRTKDNTRVNVSIKYAATTTAAAYRHSFIIFLLSYATVQEKMSIIYTQLCMLHILINNLRQIKAPV